MGTKTGDINRHTGLIGLPPFPSLAPVAAFNESQIESLIKTKGLLAFHAKHSLNYKRSTIEVGLDTTQEGIERSFLYYDIKPLRMVSQSLSMNDTLTIMSLQNTGTSVFNTTGEYIDGTGRVFIRPNDLIIIPTITELTEQLITYDGSLNWKLHYRVKNVDYMACISQERIEQDVDFYINESGEIVFINGGKVPKIGEVVSIVYYYMPLYVVRQVPHVIRILPSNKTGGSSPREAMYAPQFILADRSVIKEDTTNWQQVLEDINWRQWLDKTEP